MWGTADQIWATSEQTVLGYYSNEQGWLKEAAHLSAVFVLLRTENMHVSSLSKHVCCDKVQLWVCVRWSVGLCMFLRSTDPTGLLRRALKLSLASPWNCTEPVYYNYNRTIHTKEGRTLHCLRRQVGSELKEIQKITYQNIKMMHLFSLVCRIKSNNVRSCCGNVRAKGSKSSLNPLH